MQHVLENTGTHDIESIADHVLGRSLVLPCSWHHTCTGFNGKDNQSLACAWWCHSTQISCKTFWAKTVAVFSCRLFCWQNFCYAWTTCIPIWQNASCYPDSRCRWMESIPEIDFWRDSNLGRQVQNWEASEFEPALSSTGFYSCSLCTCVFLHRWQPLPFASQNRGSVLPMKLWSELFRIWGRSRLASTCQIISSLTAALATKIQRVPERLEGRRAKGPSVWSKSLDQYGRSLFGFCLSKSLGRSPCVGLGTLAGKRMQVKCKPCEHSLTAYESMRIECRPTSLISQWR